MSGTKCPGIEHGGPSTKLIASSKFVRLCGEEYTVSKKLEHTEMGCLLSWMSGQRKNFLFTRRKIDEEYY